MIRLKQEELFHILKICSDLWQVVFILFESIVLCIFIALVTNFEVSLYVVETIIKFREVSQ